MQQKCYLLILIFIIFIALFTSFSIDQHNKNLQHPISVETSNQSHICNEKLYPENPEIKKYFKKVSKVPYKANYKSNAPKDPDQLWKDNYGDCDDKSTAFADYLYKIGAEDVKIVKILHDSKEYAHCAVIWKNHIFDASADPPVYNMNETRYFNFLKKKGFNLKITYSYTYYKKSYF
ncbi:hypothetical protein [Methanobacterium sp.]|uniref:hypothetical protein n=1 Tax=Methanobacterium sp. TaxID=2164 RepID=UPI003C772259